MADNYCTPTLDICNFEVPGWEYPMLKPDYLAGFAEVSKRNYQDAEENAALTLIKLGSNDSGYPVHRVDVQVRAIDPTKQISFDFPNWLDDPEQDRDTQSDPSQISGDDAFLNFYGSARGNYAVGGTNADEFFGYAGSDVFYGGDGNDRMNGNTGNDELHGEGGDDVLNGGKGMDLLNGGDGNDLIAGYHDDDTIDGGAGDDCIEGGRGDDTIVDLSGHNLIYGNDASNSYDWYDTDNDTITTGWGNDTIFGQDGDDVIDACDGYNQVDGGRGNDTITTGDHADKVIGGKDNDVIATNGGDDEICAGSGKDKVKAGKGDDKVDGGSGNDKLRGQGNDDIVLGGEGNDKIWGNGGDDELAGNAGNDTLNGGNGDDTLWYGAGKDIGTGGAGDDLFKFDDDGGSLNLGKNLITDFTQDFYNSDTIDFKCVDALTHLAVVAVTEDKVRMIGYSGEEGDRGFKRNFGDKIFDVWVEGLDVGTIEGTEGSLMQDSAYDSEGSLVCLNEDVLIDIGNRGDWDLAGVPGGGDFFG